MKKEINVQIKCNGEFIFNAGGETGYFIGKDEFENAYEIYYDITNPDALELEDICDWDKPTDIIFVDEGDNDTIYNYCKKVNGVKGVYHVNLLNHTKSFKVNPGNIDDDDCHSCYMLTLDM